RQKKRGLRPGGDVELDPHRRVQSRVETFLLQRTRRFARALEELRKRLERPAYTPEALEWRLRGPLGPLALARATRDEPRQQRAPGEIAFLLAEIALALRRVKLSRE